ncbi:MAG: tetratricopeptide repeat protein [Planctomycetota bacterium]
MSKTPIVRPVSIAGSVVTLIVLALFLILGWLLSGSLIGVAVGSLVFVVVSKTLRAVIGRHHNRGISHCKRQEFERAIPEFKTSYEFFDQNSWIDRYRCIVMLSTAAMCYREMALVSLGFCYSQIGDGSNARKHYQKCVDLFPDSGFAKSALNLMDAAAQANNAAE